MPPESPHSTLAHSLGSGPSLHLRASPQSRYPGPWAWFITSFACAGPSQQHPIELIHLRIWPWDFTCPQHPGPPPRPGLTLAQALSSIGPCLPCVRIAWRGTLPATLACQGFCRLPIEPTQSPVVPSTGTDLSCGVVGSRLKQGPDPRNPQKTTWLPRVSAQTYEG